MQQGTLSSCEIQNRWTNKQGARIDLGLVMSLSEFFCAKITPKFVIKSLPTTTIFTELHIPTYVYQTGDSLCNTPLLVPGKSNVWVSLMIGRSLNWTLDCRLEPPLFVFLCSTVTPTELKKLAVTCDPRLDRNVVTELTKSIFSKVFFCSIACLTDSSTPVKGISPNT